MKMMLDSAYMKKMLLDKFNPSQEENLLKEKLMLEQHYDLFNSDWDKLKTDKITLKKMQEELRMQKVDLQRRMQELKLKEL